MDKKIWLLKKGCSPQPFGFVKDFGNHMDIVVSAARKYDFTHYCFSGGEVIKI